MRIAFPTQEDQGMESPVYHHFGTARFFIVVDSETGAFERLENQDLHHLHGQCQPLDALGGAAVDAVVVGGIGGGALQKLIAGGIRVYRAAEGTVADNFSLYKGASLPPFMATHTCKGHDADGGCAH